MALVVVVEVVKVVGVVVVVEVEVVEVVVVVEVVKVEVVEVVIVVVVPLPISIILDAYSEAYPATAFVRKLDAVLGKRTIGQPPFTTDALQGCLPRIRRLDNVEREQRMLLVCVACFGR